MKLLECIRSLLFCLPVVLLPLHAAAQENPAASTANQPSERDGQHDFDFEIGTWKTHLKMSSRLQHPFTGPNTWSEYVETSVGRRIWNRTANLVELEVDGAAGHLEALSLRLYNPEASQWNLTCTNGQGGTLSVASSGEFKNGRGEFFDTEPLKR
jgi:hypothetical protein